MRRKKGLPYYEVESALGSCGLELACIATSEAVQPVMLMPR